MRIPFRAHFALIFVLLAGLPLHAQLAVQAETLHTMAGPSIQNGVVLIQQGKVAQLGPATDVGIPQGYQVLRAKVVTPGLIDAHTVVGLAGHLNQPHDQDQLERSSPVQPELRAIDAYNARERLVEYLRGYGITTIHTGHGPGALISGQTMIAKIWGEHVEEAVIKPSAMLAATLGDSARGASNKPPGTRAKMMAMLRSEFIQAQEYLRKRDNAEEGKKPARDLHREALGRVLKGEMPLMVTAQRVPELLAAIRLAKEFGFRLVLDGAAEAHMILDEIRESGYPVILHPPMMRHFGEGENATFEAAARLKAAGIPFALQSGFESYVPKTRVVLFEAAWAAANGLSFEDALASITIDAARLLGIDDRLGSLQVGKDGDLALFDGDPFEYTSHCVGVVIEGQLVSKTKN